MSFPEKILRHCWLNLWVHTTMPSVVTMGGVLTPTFLGFTFKSTISIDI